MDVEVLESFALIPNVRSAFIDVEMTATDKGFQFDGLAAPTGVETDLGEFTEEYDRGSFRKFLASCKDNIPFLHEHNPRDLLAATRSGRLRLEEDGRGLRARADVVKTDLSERIKALVDSGDIGGMSIGMIVGRGNADISRRSGGKLHRAITGYRKILDVSTTFDPAYVATEAQFRSMAMQLADSSESLQQLLTGAYPQLRVQGSDPADMEVESAAADDVKASDEELEPVGAGEESGAIERRDRSIAARRRDLSFLILTTGGLTDET